MLLTFIETAYGDAFDGVAVSVRTDEMSGNEYIVHKSISFGIEVEFAFKVFSFALVRFLSLRADSLSTGGIFCHAGFV